MSEGKEEKIINEEVNCRGAVTAKLKLPKTSTYEIAYGDIAHSINSKKENGQYMNLAKQHGFASLKDFYAAITAVTSAKMRVHSASTSTKPCSTHLCKNSFVAVVPLKVLGTEKWFIAPFCQACSQKSTGGTVLKFKTRLIHCNNKALVKT